MVQEYDDDDGKKTFFSLNISGTPANDVGILDREQTLTLVGSCIDREQTLTLLAVWIEDKP